MTRQKPSQSYRSAPPTNPFIFTKKTVYMQRIGDAVRSGALHYISGSIPLKKAPFLVQKFASRYHVNLSRIADHRARQAGENTARWLAWLDEPTGLVHWTLFYYPGKSICREERWKNPFDDRIHITNYELVRVTKAGAKKPVLTWRYTRDQYRNLHDQIVFTVRGRQDKILDQIIHSLHRSPGFSGVREQVKKLWQIVRAEWKRTRSKSEPCPTIPASIGYVRRLPDVGMLWSELMQSKPKKGADDGHTLETPRRKAREDFLLLPSTDGSQAEKS